MLYTVQAPDGKLLTLEGPPGASEAEVIAQAQRLYNPDTQQQPQQSQQPSDDIGFFHAVEKGMAKSLKETAKTGQLATQVGSNIVGAKSPFGEVQAEGEEKPETIAEVPLELRDVLHPYDLIRKTGYTLGKSSPVIAGSLISAKTLGRPLATAGAEAGALVPLAGETGASEAAGGILGYATALGIGAGAGSMLQTLGPYYAKALKENPNDQDAAFNEALKDAAAEGLITGVSFRAFEYAPFKSQIKNILLQAFGIQPAISATGTAATNLVRGRDVTEGITPESYGQSVLGTVAPIAALKLGGYGIGKGRELAGKAAEKILSKTEQTVDKFKYMKTVEGLTKTGLSIQDAEKIATTAEEMEKTFRLSPDEALKMARKQWETDNERPPVEAVSTGEGGESESAGVGTGVPVPSPQGGGEGVVGKPAEAGTVGLVPPDTSVKPAGGGEGGVESPLVEAPIPTPKAPEIVTPEVTPPEVAPEELKVEQPETTIEPAKAEEAKVEEPAVESTAEPDKAEEAKIEEPVEEPVEEPAKVEEPSAEPVVEPVEATTTEPTGITEEAIAADKEPIPGYDKAVEAVNKQAAFPERIITPAYIAKETGLSIPEAKALLDKLAIDGVVGAKRGVSGYEQVKGEEAVAAEPAAKEPAALPEAPVVDATARKAELREKIEQAFEDDVITEDQYRESMLALQKGTGLSRKVLQLIGDKEAATKAETTKAETTKAETTKAETTKAETTQVAEQPVTEKKAQRDLTDEEFNAAHMTLNEGKDLSPELLDILGIDARNLPTTRVDQNTGKINITGMSPRESVLLLRDRLEEAHRTLGLSDSVYRRISRDINSGRALDKGTLDLLGVTEGLSPAEGRIRYLREMLNKKRREQEAAKLADEEGWVSGDTPESKIEQLAAAKARYTTTVLQMSAKLLEINKISPYEHAALVNEVTKEEPNRVAIAKLLNIFNKRTKAQEPVRLPIDEKDAAELIVKRLDAKAAEKAGPRVMAFKARPEVIEGKADKEAAALEERLENNTPDEITGEIFGESDHHPEWATDFLSQEPESTIIYSDDNVAMYRGTIDGKVDYGIIERDNPVEGLNIRDYVYSLDRNDPRYTNILYAIAEYHTVEENGVENTPEGPFQGKKGQVVISENMDKRYGNLLSALMKHLNISGLRIFLYHPEDIQGTKRHLYGLYGTRYGTIDTLRIEEGTLGHKVDMGEKIPGTLQGKDFAIMLKPGMSERLTVEVLTHELGHVIEDVAYRTASPEVKAAIKADYDKWYNESREKSPFDVLNSLKLNERFTTNLSGKDYVPGETIGSTGYDEYVRSFPEWWADNVARWMNTSAKPLSIIDKFFSGVAAQLRKLIQAVTGRPLPPSKAVASFLEDMQMGRRNYVADFLGQKVPADFDPSSVFSTGYEASNLPPRVMKAATRAKDANQEIADVAQQFELSHKATTQVDAVQQVLKGRDPAKFKDAANIYIDGLKGPSRDKALSMLPTSWVIERVEKILPSLRQVGNLLDLVAGAKDRMARSFSKMSDEINKFVTTNGQLTLARLIHGARRLQVSAAEWGRDTTLADAIAKDVEAKSYRDKAAAATDAATRTKFEELAKGREAKIAEVYSHWTELGKQAGGQELYAKTMKFYRNAHTIVQNLLRKDIERMDGLTDQEKATLMKEADEAFNISSKGYLDEDGIFRRTAVESYFPWRRFGTYWLRVEPPKGKGEGEFYVFDDAVDRETFVRERAEQLGVSHDDGKVFEQDNDLDTLRSVVNRNNMFPILQRMFKVLDKSNGVKGISLEKVKDDLVQMWLLTLPEGSVRKQFIHSGDVTGMSTDLVRVFNDTAKVYANQIAKLQYGGLVRQQINAARQAISPSDKSEYTLGRQEQSRLAAHINVVDRRAEEYINPPPRNELITSANHLAHFYFLSSPSHGLRNMLSIPMRTMPKLNAKYGYAASFNKAAQYMKILNSFKFEDTETGKAMAPSIKDSKMLQADPIKAQLFEMGLDRNAMSGQGREIIRYDVDSTDKASKIFRAVYDAGTAIFNASERISREMAYMMQAELAYEKYTREGKLQAEALELAANDAAAGVKSAIGDFSEFERPDFMRTTGKFGDAARALFMFKMWAISQAKFFWTYGDKVLRGKGLTSAERMEAAHELGGSLVMAATMGGIFGLPAVSAVCAVIDYLDDKFISDDDPEKKKRRLENPFLADSSEARFRYVWLPKHFGQVTVPGIDGKQRSLAQVIAQGPVSALTGVDIGAKTTYNNLFFRETEYSPSAVGAAANFIENNLGPDVSIGINAAEAVDNYNKGEYLRAVGNLVPSIGKGFLSAYRLSTEGLTTSKGIPIIRKDEISDLGKAATAVGFSPTALTDAYNRSSKIRGEMLRMETEKTNIKNMFLQSILKQRDMKEVLTAVKKFNDKYPQPQFMLTAQDLMNTISTYQKNYGTSVYGVKMAKPEDWMYATWYMNKRYK